MPYSDGSWGKQAKARGRRRLEYFRQYHKDTYTPHLGCNINKKEIAPVVKLVLARAKNMCEMCGSKEKHLIHHIDEDQSNNIPQNLMLLCRGCHNRVHKSKGSGERS